MRLYVSLIATAILLAASGAQAAATWTVTATASGGDINAMVAGDTLTLDITLRSDESTYGIGGSVYGFTVGVEASLDSGITSSAALVQFATGPGAGFGGLDSSLAVSADPAGGDAGVQFFNGLSVTGTPATGAADISPITSVAGDAQFRVVLTVASSASLNVGAGHATDGVIGTGGSSLVTNDVVVNYTVIPEPGTALLMGLGLAGLAAAGRRD